MQSSNCYQSEFEWLRPLAILAIADIIVGQLNIHSRSRRTLKDHPHAKMFFWWTAINEFNVIWHLLGVLKFGSAALMLLLLVMYMSLAAYVTKELVHLAVKHFVVIIVKVIVIARRSGIRRQWNLKFVPRATQLGISFCSAHGTAAANLMCDPPVDAATNLRHIMNFNLMGSKLNDMNVKYPSQWKSVYGRVPQISVIVLDTLWRY